MNWKPPGETSVAAPRTCQLVDGNAGLVVARTPNNAPTVFVKPNENVLPCGFLAPVRTGATGTETLRLTTLDVFSKDSPTG